MICFVKPLAFRFFGASAMLPASPSSASLPCSVFDWLAAFAFTAFRGAAALVAAPPLASAHHCSRLIQTCMLARAARISEQRAFGPLTARTCCKHMSAELFVHREHVNRRREEGGQPLIDDDLPLVLRHTAEVSINQWKSCQRFNLTVMQTYRGIL